MHRISKTSNRATTPAISVKQPHNGRQAKESHRDTRGESPESRTTG
jgi:hypothetical protein